MYLNSNQGYLNSNQGYLNWKYFHSNISSTHSKLVLTWDAAVPQKASDAAVPQKPQKTSRTDGKLVLTWSWLLSDNTHHNTWTRLCHAVIGDAAVPQKTSRPAARVQVSHVFKPKMLTSRPTNFLGSRQPTQEPCRLFQEPIYVDHMSWCSRLVPMRLWSFRNGTARP